MSENSLQKSIFDNLSLKESDELLKIWQENNRNEWSALTFDVIQQILQTRGIELPAQKPYLPNVEEENDNDKTSNEPEKQSPTFYQPQQVLSFAEVSSKIAWVILVIAILNGMRLFSRQFLDAPWMYLDPLTIFPAIISSLTAMISGILTFFTLKGIAYGLHILMEFEFNSRGEK